MKVPWVVHGVKEGIIPRVENESWDANSVQHIQGTRLIVVIPLILVAKNGSRKGLVEFGNGRAAFEQLELS